VTRWRIYYDDGSVYGNEDGPWGAAPQEGVLAVVTNDGRVVQHAGADYYYQFEDGSVAATGDHGTVLRAIGTEGLREPGSVKMGRWASPSRMERTFRRIREEWGRGD